MAGEQARADNLKFFAEVAQFGDWIQAFFVGQVQQECCVSQSPCNL